MFSLRRSAPIALLCCLAGAASAAATPESFRATMAAKAAALGEASVLVGQGGWLFTSEELRHYGKAGFFGPSAATVSKAKRDPDPLPAIGAFAAQCRKANAVLIVAMVPGKALLQAQAVDPALAGDARLDDQHQAFLAAVAQQGALAVDLVPAFQALKAAGAPTHVPQDSHWSPQAAAAAARAVSERLQAAVPALSAQPRKAVARIPTTISTLGDLPGQLGPAASGYGQIELSIERITLDGAPAGSWRQSPVLLIGDSHAIVYTEPIDGGIACAGAGFSDHLAAQLGFPVDRVASQADGINAPRSSLARPPRGDALAGKQAVIWLFRAASITERSGGWRSDISVVP